MKPIKEEMLAEAVSKFERLSVNADFGNLQKVLDALTQSRDSSYRERFMVTKADRLLVLKTSDVAFFYSENYPQKYPLSCHVEPVETSADRSGSSLHFGFCP